MPAAHDDGEITFYDELGVAADASSEEIRDAFRLFVRLLHPDQQTDPQLREMAEKQMRKLNRVYAVLSDSKSRRAYDEVLGGNFSPPIVLHPPPFDLRRLGAQLAWTAAILVSTGVLIWLASDNTPGVQSRGPDPNGTLLPASTSISAFPDSPATERDSAASQISRLRSDLRAVIAQRDKAISDLNQLSQASQTPPSGGSGTVERTELGPALTMTELPTSPRLPAIGNSALPRIERPANRQLAGFWFYAQPAAGQTNKNKALYLPEYIEATITEQSGMIHGRYRSRFVIADRPISPEVNFTFTGTPNGPQCSCQWTGAGGARGELTLKLTSENSMRIDWTASELGSQQALSSGTAVLTRRIE